MNKRISIRVPGYEDRFSERGYFPDDLGLMSQATVASVRGFVMKLWRSLFSPFSLEFREF